MLPKGTSGTMVLKPSQLRAYCKVFENAYFYDCSRIIITIQGNNGLSWSSPSWTHLPHLRRCSLPYLCVRALAASLPWQPPRRGVLCRQWAAVGQAPRASTIAGFHKALCHGTPDLYHTPARCYKGKFRDWREGAGNSRFLPLMACSKNKEHLADKG